MNTPVLILVYDRLEHLQRCIESLEKCELAGETIVYISSDAAFNPIHETQIQKVRNYISSINKFRQVIPLFHETNKGLIQAMEESVKLVFEKSEELIFLEDDNIVSADFLLYMNKGLQFYRNNPRVFTISGFSHSIFFEYDTVKLNQTYFTHRHCPWGFGIWKSKYLHANSYSIGEIKQDLKDRNFISRLDDVGIDLLPAFKHLIHNGNMLTADYLFVYHMIKNDLVTVAPYLSKTFNTGNDGSGNRTSRNSRFVNFNTSKLLGKNEFVFFDDIDPNINNSFNERLNKTKKNTLKKLLHRMGLLEIGYALHKLKKQWK